MGQGHAIFSSGMSPFYHSLADYFRSYLELVPKGIHQGWGDQEVNPDRARSKHFQYSRADHNLFSGSIL